MFENELIAGFTFYQLMGFFTIFFAVINIALYLYAAHILWRSRHVITQALRDKIIIEALLTFTTVMMGIGAFMDMPQIWWQVSYVCRVGLLAISPFVIYRLVKACYTVANTQQETHGKDSR